MNIEKIIKNIIGRKILKETLFDLSIGKTYLFLVQNIKRTHKASGALSVNPGERERKLTQIK